MHVPVLVEEIVNAAKGLGRTPRWYLDATFGRGGHTSALLKQFPEMQVMGLDRDPEAIAYGQANFPKVQFYHGDFLHFPEIYRQQMHDKVAPGFDLILLDLGVSSPQLDVAERGFSFYHSGPLDMRMDPTSGEPAHQIVNHWSEDALIEMFQTLGEIQRPQRVVRAILEQRQQKPFAHTHELSMLIEKIEGWRKRGQHPATRYFLALRLEVNQELKQVEQSIPHFVEALAPGGRLMIITFHSLEDRICKYVLRDSEQGQPVNKKVIQPKWSEQKQNPRARSAKLRVFERNLQP